LTGYATADKEEEEKEEEQKEQKEEKRREEKRRENRSGLKQASKTAKQQSYKKEDKRKEKNVPPISVLHPVSSSGADLQVAVSVCVFNLRLFLDSLRCRARSRGCRKGEGKMKGFGRKK